MGMRVMMGVFGMGLLLTMSSVPSAWAADGDDAAEAASVEPVAVEFDRAHILQEIESVRQTDPELAAEMESQLQLLESGELDLTEGARDVALTAPTTGDTTLNAPTLRGAGGFPSGTLGLGAPELIGPPVEGTTGGMPDYMTPELREQLFNVFDGVGRGELTEDQARGQAEAIMREHGIDPREIGPGHERDGEGWGRGIDDGSVQFDRDFEQGEDYKASMEHAFEQMSPEAREQMEKFFEGHEGTSEREFDGFEREFGTTTERSFEAPMHEYEAATREFEAATHEYEAATREFEAPMHEYEAATREYEAPTHEYEAPTHEYEAPQHEYEAPQHEYEGTPQPY